MITRLHICTPSSGQSCTPFAFRLIALSSYRPIQHDSSAPAGYSPTVCAPYSGAFRSFAFCNLGPVEARVLQLHRSEVYVLEYGTVGELLTFWRGASRRERKRFLIDPLTRQLLETQAERGLVPMVAGRFLEGRGLLDHQRGATVLVERPYQGGSTFEDGPLVDVPLVGDFAIVDRGWLRQQQQTPDGLRGGIGTC